MNDPTELLPTAFSGDSFALKPALEEISVSSSASTEHALIKRWLKDERTMQTWKVITSRANRHGIPVPPKFFINEILACFYIAKMRAPAFQHQAASARILASFLMGKPNKLSWMPNGEALAAALEKLAESLSHQSALIEKANLIQDSQKAKTSPRVKFIRMVSRLISELCHQPCHYEICVLTEIAFPTKECSVEGVRSALRSQKGLNKS
jgi:hypothetical protein